MATKNKNHDDDGLSVFGGEAEREKKSWMKLMKGKLPFPDDGNCRLF